MNLKVIKLLLLCLLLTLSTACTVVYKAKNINKDTAKVTKKMNAGVEKVTADITSLNSLKSELQTTGEMNQQPLQLLEQKIPILNKLLISTKKTTTALNHSQSEIRNLVKGHKTIPIDSPLGGKVKLQYEHTEQIIEQINENNQRYLDEREILTDKLAEYEIRQVSLVKTHKDTIKSIHKFKAQLLKKRKDIIQLKQKRLKKYKGITNKQKTEIENKTNEITAIIDTSINKLNSITKRYNVLIKNHKNKNSSWSYPENDIYNFQLFIERTRAEFNKRQTALNIKVDEWNQLTNSF